MTIHVWISLITTTGRRSTRIVAIFRVAGTRRSILINRTTWARRGAAIAIARVIVIAWWRRAPAIVIATRTIAPRRTTAIMIIVIWCRRIPPTARRRRTRPEAVARTFVLSLCWVRLTRFKWRLGRWRADVLHASNGIVLEFTTV
jgi:hypothetical protein